MFPRTVGMQNIRAEVKPLDELSCCKMLGKVYELLRRPFTPRTETTVPSQAVLPAANGSLGGMQITLQPDGTLCIQQGGQGEMNLRTIIEVTDLFFRANRNPKPTRCRRTFCRSSWIPAPTDTRKFPWY